ncbi:MAG: Undecaprenyl-diphosphatase [Candidatus Omnitrophica bacterium]|nr:Undecaprenyl-diphosphatase [Candidatus Omnitrophota bacterium]
MELIHAVILGIVEGLTEFLPVSSTGHLILAGKILGLPETDFLKSFEVAIQLGAILAVVCLYHRRLLAGPAVWLRVGAAFVPTAVIGLVLYKLIKHHLLGNADVVVWSLFIGGVLFILFERWHRERPGDTVELERLPVWKCALVGLIQAVSVVPGVSRAGATILGGLSLGIRRPVIVEFSFLLAVPTMAAATGLDLLKSSHAFSAEELGLLAVGMAVSFVVALGAIRFFIGYVQKHSFTVFGIYRIALALVYWLTIGR